MVTLRERDFSDRTSAEASRDSRSVTIGQSRFLDDRDFSDRTSAEASRDSRSVTIGQSRFLAIVFF
ncbi:MAG: hypothetical protein F6K55_07055 [Moorea sp. SIO4A3]|nr:hypothetical protein [Moorena sp. SIO4A3]